LESVRPGQQALVRRLQGFGNLHASTLQGRKFNNEISCCWDHVRKRERLPQSTKPITAYGLGEEVMRWLGLCVVVTFFYGLIVWSLFDIRLEKSRVRSAAWAVER
jgi:hypothetical protein